jgi:hypothetical protein
MFAVAVDPNPQIGREYKLNYFNPLTLAIEDLKVRVERMEKLTLGGKDYDTIVMTNSSPMGNMTVWQDREGNIIQVKAIAGITMVLESKEDAVKGLNGSTEDFAVLTSVKTSRKITNPREVRSLDVILKGVDDPSMAITDSRQSAKYAGGSPGAMRVHIAAKSFDPAKSVKLPVDKNRFRDDLAAAPYIDHDVESVARQAGQIVGDQKNAYAACAAIRAWVYQNMRSKADIGITRSASDVLKSKVGVCRDYAILFAALARGAGIPARLAAGLVYTNDAFYYHAWVECWVGQWVPFDATLPTDFVDATHIKLAEGGATSMFGLARVIGNLKAEIKGVK